MKKRLALIVLMVVVAVAAVWLPTSADATTVSSGKCGENLNWTLDDAGMLTISGTGEMYNYSNQSAPWHKTGTTVRRIIIEEGVTGVGNNAFSASYNSVYLTVIPSTLKKIGTNAFMCGSQCVIINSESVASGASTYDAIGYLLYHTSSVLVKNGISYGPYVTNGRTNSSQVTYMGQAYTMFSQCTTHSWENCDWNNALITCQSCYAVMEFADQQYDVSDTNQDSVICRIYKDGEDIVLKMSGTGGVARGAWRSYLPVITRIVIEEGVTRLPSRVFEFSGAKSISIPASCTDIGQNAFSDSKNLESIWIHENNPTYTSDAYGVLYNKDKTTLICAPAAIGAYRIPDSVTSIESSAFKNCAAMTSVTIPNTVKKIDGSVFSGCSALETVTIPEGVTYIERSAFHACTGLKSVTIADSVSYIGEGAFSQCSALESITIPFVGRQRTTASQTYQYPFGVIFGTYSYAGTEKTPQPFHTSSLTSVKYTTYYVPTSLRSVTVTGGEILYGAFYNCKNLTSINLPSGITAIEGAAFTGCSSLNSIVVPNGVTAIGEAAFDSCGALNQVTFCGTEAQWAQMTIGASNDSLLAAHRVYHNLTAATCQMPSSCIYCGQIVGDVLDHSWQAATCTAPMTCSTCGEQMGEPLGGAHVWNAATCTTPKTCSLCGCTEGQALPHDWIAATCTSAKTCAICRVTEGGVVPCSYQNNACIYCGKTIVKSGICGDNLQWTLNSANVLSITGTGAMYDYNYTEKAPWDDDTYSITTVNLGEGITHVGSYAFYFCTRITKVMLPDSLCSIGERGFFYCSKLGTITIPNSVTEIAEGAFGGCAVLDGIWVSEEHPVYSNDAFGALLNKEQSTLVAVPASVQTYEIPHTVLQIGAEAFTYCEKLTYIAIPEGVAHIATHAFMSCDNLREVVIPSTLTSVDNSAFYFCYELQSVIYCGTEEEWSKINFGWSNTQLTNATRTYHKWCAATCEEAKTCVYCATATGTALGHSWRDATCTTAKTCNRCGETEGEPLGHDWQAATCAAPMICSVCMQEQGEPLGHSWQDATCIDPKTCSVCLQTEGAALGHTYTVTETAPTCTQEGSKWEKCDVCGHEQTTVYEALGHTYSAEFTWAEDHEACTLAIMCARNCGLQTVLDCSVSHSEPHKPQTTHLASVQYDGQEFSHELICQNALVSFQNWDGSILSSSYYHLGEMVQIPADPSKDADDTYTYSFAGWDQAVVNCAGEAVYTATYDAIYISYTVVFKNADGTVLSDASYHWGDVLVAPADPVKVADRTFTYTFAGWDQSLICTGDMVITAVYEPVYIEYTVVFQNWNGQVLQSKHYHFGESVEMPADPTKEADNTYTYTFAGWDSQVGNCTEDVVYTAVYTPVYIPYTVCFMDEDGTQLSEAVYHYGDLITAPAQPVKATDADFIYTFAGWGQPVTVCQGNHTYTAEYVISGFASSYIKLTQNTDIQATLTADLYCDLNGFTLSGMLCTNGYQVYGMDSATNAYTCQNMGYFQCVNDKGGAVVPQRHVMTTVEMTGAIRRYLAIPTESGYTFHRFYLAVTHYSIAPKDVAVGFKAVFYADEMVVSELDKENAFGYTISLQGGKTLSMSKAVTDFFSGKTLSLRIKNYDPIIGGERILSCNVFFQLADGTVINSSVKNTSLRSILEGINHEAVLMEREKLLWLKEMIDAHPVMKKWDVNSILFYATYTKPQNPDGDPSA